MGASLQRHHPMRGTEQKERCEATVPWLELMSFKHTCQRSDWTVCSSVQMGRFGSKMSDDKKSCRPRKVGC